MRIVRVRHIFYPDIPKDYVYELCVRQVMMRHHVDVITWAKDNESCVYKAPEGFTIHRLSGLNFSLGNMIEEYPFTPSLSQRIKLLNPDIIHAESHLFLPSLQAVRKAREMGKPCIVTIHGVFAERGPFVNFLQFAYMRTLGLEIFKNANRIICLTRTDANEIIKIGCPEKKIRIIPNAVDTEKFKPSKVRRDDLIVWTGRFVPEKGIEYLIKAAKIVCENIRYCRFLLIGHGPLKQKILKLISEYGIERFVDIIGPLARDKIAKILKSATIFAFPSLREGMPLSVLEAMACGLPVIGSNVPGIKDIIIDGENGILVPPRNPEKLADAILTILNDRTLRQKIGQNARELILKKYSWEVVLDRIMETYYEALEDYGEIKP